MKILKFENKADWEQARFGKITGTKLNGIITKRGTGKKIGFYELIAERIAEPSDGQNPMERGIELEPLAIAEFEKETGKKVNTDLVIWTRDDNEDIAISPDGTISDTEAVEAKCLSSARHIEALVTKETPKEHLEQTIQYFIVNEKLETLYLVFYDPRIIGHEFFFITIEREDIQDKITEYLEYQRITLIEIEEIVKKLTF